ncbi:hypothetical protein LOZ80_25850 [Paenibacillus sp. HWE-109]|uniref:hypothetical protein n=1 Tax=Paenibacillus sp. HWE-109 TaxID=1306526 RepID=UPI001EDDBC1B|nr:hypothetical protein [Paenibacillus sp. HWE-109]UKS25005.1 hypothetical protein LOZ80_25850 [Paenibacillus sp. HWE-109]
MSTSFTDADTTIQFFEDHISILRNQQTYLKLNYKDVIIAPGPIPESNGKRALTIFEIKTNDVIFRFASMKSDFEPFIESLMNHIYRFPSNH